MSQPIVVMQKMHNYNNMWCGGNRREEQLGEKFNPKDKIFQIP